MTAPAADQSHSEQEKPAADGAHAEKKKPAADGAQAEKKKMTVSAGSVTDGRATEPFNGYSVLEAADLDAAVDLVRSHPYVERGGSLQVSEAVTP